jgi:ABC-type multidrug transport system ATPase subunit
MRILTTTLQPTAGQVRVGGINVLRNPHEVRRRLGYLPQEFGFYRNLNAFEMLDYIATMKGVSPGERKRQVERVIEQVNLHDVARRRIGGYSGGMKQRLGIAQALLGDPQLLIVDEPTAGLDPEERIRFRNLLAQLAAERTVILSTHIVADIEASCSAMAVLRAGRVVFQGTPAQLIGAARGRIWQIETNQAAWERMQRYQIIASRPDGAGLRLRLLADHNPFGCGAPADPSLEDGYVAVVHDDAAVGEAAYA